MNTYPICACDTPPPQIMESSPIPREVMRDLYHRYLHSNHFYRAQFQVEDAVWYNCPWSRTRSGVITRIVCDGHITKPPHVELDHLDMAWIRDDCSGVEWPVFFVMQNPDYLIYKKGVISIRPPHPLPNIYECMRMLSVRERFARTIVFLSRLGPDVWPSDMWHMLYDFLVLRK